MSTTIHFPPKVLRIVDRKARALRVSRSRFILDSVLKCLADEQEPAWSPDFFEKLQANREERGYLETVNAVFDSASKSRRSRKVVRL